MAIAASSLLDGGVFWNVVTSIEPVDPKTLPESGLLLGMTFSALAYLPALMALAADYFAEKRGATYLMGLKDFVNKAK